jgi:pimeloyl-ACP methyl ester carboxylesterase
MPIDEAVLRQHRGYEDPQLGLREEFLQPELGSGRTVAVLSRPTGPSQPVGFVLCHSFAAEQLHLSRLEAVIARRVAAAGFPVLRYHGQGYGDSEGRIQDIRLSTHLSDAKDAVSLMSELSGVERVGVMGPRLGGLVAALTADREGLDLLVAWQPVVSGQQYMRDFIRQLVLHSVVLQAGERASSKAAPSDLRAELRERGWLDVKGFPLSEAAFEEIAGLDLLRELRTFDGHSLVVSIGRTERVDPAIDKLVARLAELGGDCTHEAVRDPGGGQFGQHHHQNQPGGIKIDRQFELADALAEVTVGWVQARAGGLAASAPERPRSEEAPG